MKASDYEKADGLMYAIKVYKQFLSSKDDIKNDGVMSRFLDDLYQVRGFDPNMVSKLVRSIYNHIEVELTNAENEFEKI